MNTQVMQHPMRQCITETNIGIKLRFTSPTLREKRSDINATPPREMSLGGCFFLNNDYINNVRERKRVMTNLRRATIVNAINHPNVSLYKSQDCWYFVYDNVDAGIYETRTVYVWRLNEFSLDQWIEEGNDFVEEVEGMNV